MKRKTVSRSQTAPARTHAVAAHRLTAVRGGLDIAVAVVPPLTPDMQNQHNETLIQL
jgi:hypothetical protein